MHVLIVGGTRFIGAYTARRLHDLGHDVVLFHRGLTASPVLPPVRHVHDPSAGTPVVHYPEALTRARFDVVLHMVAQGESDGRAFVDAFDGRAGRLVVVSSGDVYRAYGRWTRLEPGPVEPTPLREDAPLRTRLYPYRTPETPPDDPAYGYEKILAERAVMGAASPWVVLRLPKVYGRGDNEDLATVYAATPHPAWRWTHGYVENVADAVALAATHPVAARRIYNVGEADTPTTAERLRALPPPPAPVPAPPYDFAQDIAYDTGAIRRELGYAERTPEPEAMGACAERSRVRPP